MEAVKQIVRISKDHEIRIKVPKDIPENEIVEVILIMKNRQDSYKQKIRELKNATKDKLFLEDMKEIYDDFNSVDLEGLTEDAV